MTDRKDHRMRPIIDRPDFTWDDALELGLVATQYVDAADLITDALDVHWDNLHAAATMVATATAADTTLPAVLDRNDDLGMDLAMRQMARHGGLATIDCTWEALEAHLIYWVCYDEAMHDLIETIDRIDTALDTGELPLDPDLT